MKVVYFSHSDGIYGAPKSLLDMILVLKDGISDFYPIVVTSKVNQLNAICNELGIENYSVYYADCLYEYETNRSIGQIIHDARVCLKMKYRHDYVNLKAIEHIEKLIDFRTIDIVHSNVSTIDVGAIIAKKYGIKHIWHIREYGQSEKRKFHPYIKDYYKYIDENSDGIVLISEFVKRNWIKQGLSTSKAIVLYDAVGIPKYEKTEKNNKVKILFAGSANPAKGVDDLLEAISILVSKYKETNFVLDLFGNYNNKFGEKVHRWISDNGLEEFIHVKGYDSKLTDKMYKYDIGVVCSRNEALGRITIEYMEAGLCLVASNTGANPELVDGCKEVVLYKQGDTRDLAAKLQSLIKLDGNQRLTMGDTIREYALNKFGKENFVRELLSLYGMENLKSED